MGHAAQPPALTLSWALAQLQSQLGGGGGLESQKASCGCACPSPAPRGQQAADEPRSSPNGDSAQDMLGCTTPANSDGGAHPASSEPGSSAAAQQRAHLSVRWAAALEQREQRAYAPQHCAPDKPCLKACTSPFPYLEEAAQLEGLLRRPRALVLAQLNPNAAASTGDSRAPHDACAARKRGRVAAFGQ